MARNRASLYSRLDALESKIISNIDRRVQLLSRRDRLRYEHWRQEYHDWSNRKYNPYAAYLDGDEGPKLPKYINIQLFPDMPIITETDTYEDIRDKFERMNDERI